jgi:predicted esterase
LAVEYPGYGDLNFSRGITTTKEIKREANALIHFLLNDCGLRASDLILGGRSIGSAVVLYIEEILQEPPAGILLI